MPHGRGAVLARALGIEAVRLSDATGFMVAADEVDALRVTQFKTD